jgi:type VI secretion system secreted protein VgrG
MPRTQAHRPIAVATPLGDEKVLIKSFAAAEQLSRPFRIELELLSEDGTIQATDVLGQRMTLRVAQPDGGTRYFNGHVSRWYQTTPSGGMARYRATLVPWFWLLTRAADCRIFQELSIPDIVQQVFRDQGFSDFQLNLNGTYDPLEYCVQYRETDFNFVSRLLEQAGIYYWFKHEDGKHTMVLSDSPAAHRVNGGYGEIAYHAPDRVVAGREFITDFSVERRVQTGKFVHTDFDFTKPDTNLETRSDASVSHAGSAFRVFDYPGEYATTGLGETLAKVRMEEMQAEHETAQGETDSRGVAAGYKFTLKGFPREDLCKEWLVTSTTIHAESDSYEGGGAGSGAAIYRCSFTAIDASVQYRPARLTPKPLISGPQTAIVAGKAGEEIWTDKHGRIKVVFHWDREGKHDETSSCWMRVAQAWAGKKFGAMFLPRIGHEVIVEFLEGDPDRPIVTGCVYNAREGPAYALPDHMTRSGLKTNSSKGGGGFNEIRFEDKKGEEQVFFHAEKNQDVRVKNDSFEWVGHDRHLIVKNDQVELVENDRSEHVKRDHKETIDRDRNLHVKGKEAKLVEKTLSLTVAEDVAEVFKKNHSETVTEDLYIKARNIVIEAVENLTLKAGTPKTYIAMTKDGAKLGTDGEIVLDAKKDITQKTLKNFVLEATMNMNLKGTAGMTVEGVATAELKSPQTTVKGDGMLTMKGGLVMIN